MIPATLVSRELRAMGCEVVLRVVAPDTTVTGPAAALPHEVEAALDAAAGRLEELEQRWSRFRPDSELSRLNREGRLEGASEDTYGAIDAALEAWRVTDARFDPTVLDALVAAGYDRTFAEVQERGAVAAGSRGAPAPGPVGIELDPRTRTISLPPGVHLDLGGIGKGRAADAVTQLLHERLGTGVCADLGGDVRVLGPGPDGGPWGVAIEDPFDPRTELTVVGLEAGAVATSARTRRTWRSGAAEGPAHHLIDPATGRPSTSGLASVTVIAQEAQWAEVMAKAAFVAGLGPGADLVQQAGLEALLVTDERWVVRTPGFHRFTGDAPDGGLRAGAGGGPGGGVGEGAGEDVGEG